MARVTFTPELEEASGRADKKKNLMFRTKHFRDPLTGELLKKGPNEWYRQDKRDYKQSPRTPAEQRQAEKWRNACRQTQVIKNDRSHPRYAELYARWRAQIHTPDAIIQFGCYIRSVLAKKDCP